MILYCAENVGLSGMGGGVVAQLEIEALSATGHPLTVLCARRDGHEGEAILPSECYLHTPYEHKIKQLNGNSVEYDFSIYENNCDFILIDGDHSYEAVKSDTHNAFRMLRPGGVIVWDDYVWLRQYPECEGVARCLHEYIGIKKIRRIAGTRFAIYRDE